MWAEGSTMIIEIMISNYAECKFLKLVEAWNEKYHSWKKEPIQEYMRN